MSKSIKSAIVNETNLLASSHFITGFELEFHACNGEVYKGERNTVNDYDRAMEHLKSSVTDGNSSVRTLLRSEEASDDSFAIEVMKANSSSTARSLISSVTKLLSHESEEVRTGSMKIISLITDMTARMASYHWTEDDCESLLDMDNFQKSAPTNQIYKLPEEMASLVQIKMDSSVRGGELVLAEPQLVSKALEVSKALFTENKFKLDSGCSFHIHLSIPGISHSYSAGLQWELMLYVLSQYNRAPSSLKTRWKKSTNYYRTQLSQEKYTFVNFHNQYKTWEFRCFGNIRTQKDAVRCYEIALEAMQHAYAVQLGLKESLAAGIFTCASQRDVMASIADQLKAGRFNIEELNQLISNNEAA